MSRIELAKIPALTFYRDELTKARRTSPIRQLTCVGSPCKLYTPDVVRCENLGGSGVDVDWKCTADLPSSLRFGKVEVSCEGWSKPGDLYVLKGSCGLTYRLVEIPRALHDDSYLQTTESWDVASIVFTIVWVIFLAFIILKSCFNSGNGSRTAPQPPSGTRPGSGWFPGGDPDDAMDPPPPYTKHTQNNAWGTGWRPGFWTGAALGGLGAHLWNNRRAAQERPGPRQWDWENPLRSRPYSNFWGGRRGTASSDDRGEGPSNLGAMRQSTGYGVSSVR